MKDQAIPSTEHLEERLLDLYVLKAPEVDERRSEIAAHLEQCVACAKRYQVMSEYYAQVEVLQKVEAESIFPALQASSRLVRPPFAGDRGPLRPAKYAVVQIVVSSFKTYPIRWSAALAVILTALILLVPRLGTSDRNPAYVRAKDGYLIVQNKDGEELWRKYVGPGIDAGIIKIPPAGAATTGAAGPPEKSGSSFPLAAMPYEGDSHTALLDHFNGMAAGAAFGSPGYDSSLPAYGQAINLVESTYVKYTFLGWGEHQGTIEMWIKPRQVTHSALLALEWLDVTSYPQWGRVGSVYLNQEDKLVWSPWNGEGDASIVGKTTIPPNQWTHIAVTWGAEGTRLYVNGVVDASSSANDWPCLSSPTYAYLHYWGYADLGYVDELRISDVARSSEEIRAQAVRIHPLPIKR